MKFLTALLGILFCSPTTAGVFKCTSSDGKTEYRSAPCAVGQNNVLINIKTGSLVNLDEVKKQQVAKQQQEVQTQESQKTAQNELSQKQNKLKQDAAAESAKNQFLIKNNPQQYSPFAIPPYKPDNLPTLVKLFQDRLPEIERMRRQAAQRALSSGQCIRVESVELNIKSTKNSLVFLVDCSTAKRFYITEQELPPPDE